jgi:small subunit ribosomal protein S18
VYDQEVEELNEESGRSGGRGAVVGRFQGRRAKVCNFCIDKVHRVPYRDADILRKYLTERGKIRPRRQTGTCARHQRSLAVAVKRARHLALLPFTAEHLRGD